MQINNFKRLQEEEEIVYREQHDEKVRAGLLSSLGMFRFVGQVVDMYLPKLFDLLIMAAGGKTDSSATTRGKSIPPSQAPEGTNGKRRPGESMGDDISSR
ncbi:MAG: hypothetical protein SFU99_08025 [Saprospiraceae bacterium]|nr:hypothetical protein [Saprospiraceae bacterium]